MDFQNISIAIQVLFYLFCIIIIIQIIYYLFIFRKLNVYKPLTIDAKFPKISVIICAKNEAENLLENLPFIIHQEYPNFEIIVIDDASSDNTLEILDALQKNLNI